MGHAPYDAIADWYDQYVREKPLYAEVVLPGMLELLGEVRDQEICDIGCGQGLVARELARRGARVTGADISAKLLELARQYEAAEPLGIHYIQADARDAPDLPDAHFDGVTCSLALMPIADLGAAFRTMRRITRPGGRLVFAITHPCYETPRARWVEREDGTVAREVGGYFDERYWTSENSAGVRGQVGEYHRTLSTYLNTLIEAGFVVDRLAEPIALGRRGEQVPGNREVPSILLVRAVVE